MVRIRPGAFSCHHGAVLVLSAVAQANASKHPAETALTKTLSRRMLPLIAPATVTVSTTSAGVRQFTVKLEVILTAYSSPCTIEIVPRDSFLNARTKLECDRVGKTKREKLTGMHGGLGSLLSTDPTRPEKQSNFYVGGVHPTTPMLSVRKTLSITMNRPIVSSSGTDHRRTWPEYEPSNFEDDTKEATY